MWNCTMALVPKESIELANKFFDSLQKEKEKEEKESLITKNRKEVMQNNSENWDTVKEVADMTGLQ